MMLPNSFFDAMTTARLMVLEIMYSDKRPHEIEEELWSGRYTVPTEEEAKTWSVGMTNTSSAHAMYAVLDYNIRQIQSLLRKRQPAKAFAQLYGTMLLTHWPFER